MAKPTSKEERGRAIDLVETRIRKSGFAPGFDYPKAILELSERFSQEEIALACEVEKGTISNWLKGTMPHHDSGERLYILYVETFSVKNESGEIVEEKRPPCKKPS